MNTSPWNLISRTEFATFAPFGAAIAGFGQSVPLTAGQVVEYTVDATTAGEHKGMILIGHWVSEDQGMRLCGDWLKTFVSEVPIQWIPAGDPFWRP